VERPCNDMRSSHTGLFNGFWAPKRAGAHMVDWDGSGCDIDCVGWDIDTTPDDVGGLYPKLSPWSGWKDRGAADIEHTRVDFD
jgi:hypothetical protein